MKFLSTVPVSEVKALQEQLVLAGHETTITYDAEFTYLNTTEAGEKWIRAKIKAGEVPVSAKPKVQSEGAPSIKNDMLKVWLPAVAIVIFIFWGFSAMAGSADPVVYGPDQWKEANAEKFGLSSDCSKPDSQCSLGKSWGMGEEK